MNTQISLLQEAPVHAAHYAHQAHVSLPIPLTEGLDEAAVMGLLVEKKIPLLAEWPERDFGHEPALIDLYRRRKPITVGYIKYSGLVKVEESWVLHGTIHYMAGEFVKADAFASMHLSVMSLDIDRNDKAKGRTPVRITKVIGIPPQEIVEPKKFAPKIH